MAAHWQIDIQEQKTVEELPAKTLVPIFSVPAKTLLHSSQHSELLGIDSLIMKCGICGSQIMVLILARDTTHWAVRVLSSSSVPAHLPINWLEGA